VKVDWSAQERPRQSIVSWLTDSPWPIEADGVRVYRLRRIFFLFPSSVWEHTFSKLCFDQLVSALTARLSCEAELR
jgi:hypothetical protein